MIEDIAIVIGAIGAALLIPLLIMAPVFLHIFLDREKPPEAQRDELKEALDRVVERRRELAKAEAEYFYLREINK